MKVHYHVLVIAYEKQVENQFISSTEIEIILSQDVKPEDIHDKAISIAKSMMPNKNGYYVRSIFMQHEKEETCQSQVQ